MPEFMSGSFARKPRVELPVDPDLKAFQTQVYAPDSTIIDLCLKLFPGVEFRRRKAGLFDQQSHARSLDQ